MQCIELATALGFDGIEVNEALQSLSGMKIKGYEMTGKNNQNNQSNQSNQNNQNSTGADGNGTIEGQANTGAAGSTAEDTLDGYKALVEQMKSQNEALMSQNKSLQSQFETLIRNGAGVTQQQQQQAHDNGPDDAGEHYTSLADLGNEIGKRDYKSHNMKEW